MMREGSPALKRTGGTVSYSCATLLAQLRGKTLECPGRPRADYRTCPVEHARRGFCVPPVRASLSFMRTHRRLWTYACGCAGIRAGVVHVQSCGVSQARRRVPG